MGILEPNQLFFKSSQSNLITVNGVESDIITGDVLITREPCRLPTDVQKVRFPPHRPHHSLKEASVASYGCVPAALP